MFRHRPLGPLVCLFCVLLLTACSPSGDSTADGGGEAGRPGKRFLSLGTAPPGGTFFVIGGALADVAGTHAAAADGSALGWQVTAEATKGTRENIRRLASGELDFALANSAITYFAVRGESGWDQAYDMRTVMTLAPNVALFVAPASAGIESIADLAGKRVVIGPSGAGFELFVEPILRAHGLSYEDMTVLNNTQSGAVDMLADGSADAAFLGGGVPTASITQAATSMDLTFVPFDEAARQQLIADYPFFAPATIPADTYPKQRQAFEGMNVGSMHLITAAGQDDAMVHALTRAIYEHRQEVVDRHPAGRAIQPAVVVRDTGTPFHSGALRYYQESGIATPPEGTEAGGAE